jgi:hypothetical protein
LRLFQRSLCWLPRPKRAIEKRIGAIGTITATTSAIGTMTDGPVLFGSAIGTMTDGPVLFDLAVIIQLPVFVFGLGFN